MFLDLNVTFDAVGYVMLIGWLANRLYKGLVLQWLKSYLCNHIQPVTIVDAMSLLGEFLFIIPQVLVLDPLLVLYALPLSGIVDVSMFIYVNHSQQYVTFDHWDTSSTREVVTSLECCTDDIRYGCIEINWKLTTIKLKCSFFFSSCQHSRSEDCSRYGNSSTC